MGVCGRKAITPSTPRLSLIRSNWGYSKRFGFVTVKERGEDAKPWMIPDFLIGIQKTIGRGMYVCLFGIINITS